MIDRPGFDAIDLTALTTSALCEYLAQVRSHQAAELSPFSRQAYDLRIAGVEREIAIRNVRALAARPGWPADLLAPGTEDGERAFAMVEVLRDHFRSQDPAIVDALAAVERGLFGEMALRESLLAARQREIADACATVAAEAARAMEEHGRRATRGQ
jgi:hypothetical protein